MILEDIDDLSYDLEKIFPPGSRILVQDYIEGIDVSVSLLCDGRNAIPICLNEQFVELKMIGELIWEEDHLLRVNTKMKLFKWPLRHVKVLKV